MTANLRTIICLLCTILIGLHVQSQSFVKVDLGGGIVHDGYLSNDPVSIGTGAAWFDANVDGHLDLYITMRNGPNMLWIGDGRGNFVESAAAYGVRDSTGEGAGVSVADFNNDGYPDFYLANGKEDRLYRNDGGTGFTNIIASAGFDTTSQSRGTTPTWADFNNDGYVDLYVTNYNKIQNTTNASSQDRLYMNNGDETFTDVSNVLTATGVLNGYGFIGGWTDFDHDGDMDLVLINDCVYIPFQDYRKNQFFRNDGDTDSVLVWKFTEISDSLGVDVCENGMGLAIGDYNRDGWMDYFFSNIGPAILMKNTGGAFTDVSTIAGVNGQVYPDYSWGTCFADINLDGWSDLYLVLGTYHFSSSDFPKYNMLFLNNQNGIDFSDVSEQYDMADSTRGRTVVMADYDEDGDPDFCIVNFGEEIILKRNDIHQTGHFIKIDLEGTTSNRDGIGAKLKLCMPDNSHQYWEMRSGSSLGGGDALTALFGLADNTQVDTLEIQWPSGCTQIETNIPADQRVLIKEFNPDSSVVQFVNRAPDFGITRGCGNCGIGNGVSFADFDGDGLDDLTFGTQTGDSVLFYRNTGSGFEKLPALVTTTCKSEQVLWVDLDNDGDKDFVVTCFMGQNRVFENTGNLQLVEVTSAAGFATRNDQTYGVTAGDYDKDGDLDLYFANWSYPASLGFTNYLYTNNGDWTFTDNTTVAGVADGYELTFCSAFFDYDGDGWLDLYNSQDRKTSLNSLFRNDGDGTFTDVSSGSGSDVAADAMNVGIGDYDRDGDYDIYITNTTDATNNPPYNILLQNQGDGTFTNVAEDVGVAMYKVTWCGNWVDVDLDMDPDLYVSAQHMGQEFSNDLFINAFPLDTFYTTTIEGDTMNCFSNAIGDFNNDGLPDIALNNATAIGDPENDFQIWENQSVTGNHWLKIQLRGIASNRNGIGSRIELYSDGNAYVRTTTCGTAFIAQNSFIEFFGLGSNMSVDSLKVHWMGPGDHVTTLYQVMGDQLLTVYETDKIYVDADAAGANDGLTWAGAFTDLKDALAFAAESHIKQIWVAEGTYYPTDTSRTESFTLSSNVCIYGGFSGGETMLGDRDPDMHPVVLSGDIGTPDDSTDNVYHVIVVDAGVKNCIVDGVHVVSGQADGAGSDSSGGGVYCVGTAILNNILIQDCVATGEGSAVYVTGANARLKLEDVIAHAGSGSTENVFTNNGSAILTISGNTQIQQ